MSEPTPYQPPTESGDPPSPVDDPPQRVDRPRVWTVFVTLLLAIVLAVAFQGVAAGVMVAMEVSSGTEGPELAQNLLDRISTAPGFILFAGMGQLAFLAATLIATKLSPVPFRERVGWLPPKATWRIYPLTMLSSLFPLGLGLGGAWLVSRVMPPDDSLMKLFDSITPTESIFFVLFIGIVPGVVEELLFRGYMQRRFVQRWGALTGILVTSLLFALVHGTPVAIAAAAPLGLWFGYLAWRADSIWPTILCHFFVNAGLNAWRMIVKFGEVPETAQTIVHIAAVAIGLVCFTLVIRGRDREQLTVNSGQ